MCNLDGSIQKDIGRAEGMASDIPQVFYCMDLSSVVVLSVKSRLVFEPLCASSET